MSTNKFQYWPSNGQLGSTKFTMPTNAEDWPSGDALVGSFVYSEGKLVDFIDTKALVANESKSTTFPYDYVSIQVDKSLEGVMTFNQSERTKYFTVSYATSPNDGGSYDYIIVNFNTADQTTIDAVRSAYRVVNKTIYDVDGNVIGTWDTSKLEVGGINDDELVIYDGLFANTQAEDGSMRDLILAEFNSDLSSLTKGSNMFQCCWNITSFPSDLPNLTNGDYMFYESGLTSFSSDLSSLVYGDWMFTNCQELESFDTDLSSLNFGSGMFEGCLKLSIFNSNLESLINGDCMFNLCENLTTFNANLSSLTNGENMFTGCKLSVESVENIANSLPTVSDNNPLHLDIDLSSVPSTYAGVERPSTTYQWYENPELGDFIPHLQTIVDKGWVITLNNIELERWGNNLGSDPY